MPISNAGQSTIGVVIRADGVVETANGIKLTAVEVKKLGEALTEASNDARSFATTQGGAATAVDKAAQALKGGTTAAAEFTQQQKAMSAGTVALISTVTSFVTTAGLQLVSHLIESGRRSVETGAEIARLSEKYKITAESLSTLKYAADLSDTSMEAVASGLDRMGKNAVQASKGTGEAAVAFRVLGVDVKDTSGQIKGQEQLLYEVADQISRVEDSTTRAALAQMVFGRAGADLLPFLNNGADGLRRLQAEGKQWAEIAGISAEEAKKLKDQQKELEYASDALGKSIATTLVPALNGAIRAFIEARKEGRNFLVAVGKGVEGAFTMPDLDKARADVKSYSETLATLQDQLEAREASGRQKLGAKYDPDADPVYVRVRDAAIRAQQGINQANARLKAEDPDLFSGAGKSTNKNAAGDLALDAITRQYRSKEQRMTEELRTLAQSFADSGQTPEQRAAYENAAAEINRKYSERERANRTGSVKADPADSVLQSLGADNAKLDFQIKHFEEFGEKAESAKRALIEFEIEYGKLKGATPEKQAQARNQAAAIDDKVAEVAFLKADAAAQEAARKSNSQSVVEAYNTSMRAADDLRQRVRQNNVAIIADDRTRAFAQFELDKEAWRRRVETAKEGTEARRQAESEYADWVISETERIETSLKPSWQRMLEGWQDVTRQMRDSYNSLQSSVQQAGEQIAVQFGRTGRLSGQSLLQAFQDELSKSVYRRFFAPALAGGVDAIWKLFNGGDGTSGNASFAAAAGAGSSDVFAPELHGGGIAGSDGRMRRAPAGVFAGARRYHSGGLAGDEVPAILRRGEEVLTERDPRHRNNAGAAANLIINLQQAPGVQTQVSQTQQPDGTMVVDLVQSVILQDGRENGPITQMFGNIFGTRRAALN